MAPPLIAEQFLYIEFRTVKFELIIKFAPPKFPFKFLNSEFSIRHFAPFEIKGVKEELKITLNIDI